MLHISTLPLLTIGVNAVIGSPIVTITFSGLYSRMTPGSLMVMVMVKLVSPPVVLAHTM